MSAHTSTTAYLTDRYGPLLTLTDVAGLLRRSSKAVEVAMYSRRDDDWVRTLRAASVRIGRRRLFRATGVAALIDGQEVA
jgi:hypothetical protein